MPPAAKAAWILGLLLTASCLSYRFSAVGCGTPLPVDEYQDLEVGRTTLSQAVEALGPPEGIGFTRADEGGQHLRMEYMHQKQQSSNLSLSAPFREVSAYNSGVSYFITFLDVMRGGSIVPDRIDDAQIMGFKSPLGTEFPAKLSDWREQLSGRGTRLEDLRRERDEPGIVRSGGPVSPFIPLKLSGSDEGMDLIRLEFDEQGNLVQKEMRAAAPRAGFKEVIRQSFLQ